MIMFWFEHGGYGMDGWGWGLLPGLIWLAFWALVVTAVVLVVRGVARSRPAGPPAPYADSPERLLAERYARGEIDDDEYRHRLETLRSR
jgi:putative membrane protein